MTSRSKRYVDFSGNARRLLGKVPPEGAGPSELHLFHLYLAYAYAKGQMGVYEVLILRAIDRLRRDKERTYLIFNKYGGISPSLD